MHVASTLTSFLTINPRHRTQAANCSRLFDSTRQNMQGKICKVTYAEENGAHHVFEGYWAKGLILSGAKGGGGARDTVKYEQERN